MQALRRINNNVALCRDGSGRELIAMGKGVGFGSFPRELALSEIERTFYDTDEKYRQLVAELPEDVLAFAARIVEIAGNELPYALSPNAAFTLADHISFAMERARKNIRVKMPLAYDVEQLYPAEYRIAQHAIRRIRKEFCVALPECETAGIAMSLLNSKLTQDEPQSAETDRDEEMLEDVTEIVENELHILGWSVPDSIIPAMPPICSTCSSASTRGRPSAATICSCTPACGRSSRRSPPAWKRSPSTSNGNGTAL